MKLVLIGIQGGKGSFCEEAANIFAKNHGIDNYDISYLISSMSVLASIERGDIDYGIFAMENAQGGVVIESIEALAEHCCRIIEAARRLGEGKLPGTVGVVGSEYCAELYDLNIIARDIHDLKHNLTLFIGVSKMKV